MRLRLFLGFLISILMATAPSAYAQDQPTSPVGFTDPMDVSAIESYRLPTWSFTQIRLNLGSDVFRTGAEKESSESILRSYQAQFAPDFETFYESEDRVFSLRVTPTYGYNRFYQEQDTRTRTTERTEVNTDAVLDVNLSLNEYVGDEVFVDVWTGNEVDRRFEEVEEERSGTEPVENSRVRVDYSSSARLGIGLGRVRNVTPVVRALRVRERMRELGMDEMGRDQVQAAAQQFAAIPASRNRIVAASTLAWDCGTICSAS